MKQLVTKLSAIALMTLLSSNVMAIDYYISTTGNDANDGTSSNAPFATLSTALKKLSAGDILHVSGIIKMTEQCVEAHKNNITIQGTDPNEDGFDGQGQCGILSLNNSYYTLKNLCFKNGKVSTGGAAIMGNPVNLTINNCIFEDNVNEETNGNNGGGAIYVLGSETVQGQPVALKIIHSQFLRNKTNAVNGGAIRTLNLPVTIEQCYFDGNTAVNGGAINSITPQGFSVSQCLFTQNSASAEGGVINLYLRKDNNNHPIFTGPYEIKASTFYNNSSARNGLCQFNVSDQVEGLENRKIDFDNCTMAENQAVAVYIYGKNADVNFVNSILESNKLATQTNYTDVQFFSSDFTTQKVAFTSSVVGSISGYNAANYIVAQSCLNKTTKPTDVKYAGLAAFQDNCFPLLQASLATQMGTSENRPTTDQLGTAWTENYIGAVQKTVAPEDGIMYVASVDENGNVDKMTISRKLVGGEWNTFCVPFNLNNPSDNPARTEFATCFGDGAKIACWTINTKIADGVIPFEDRSNYNAHDIVAGRAYIVKPAQDVHVIFSKKPTTTGGQAITLTGTDGTYKFIGALNPIDLQTTDVCLGRGGSFFHPAEGKTKMPGLRGYFQFPANANVSSAKVYVGGVSDTTDIIDLKANGKAKNAKIYTLGGQYVGTDAQSLPKGIYVIGNKKVVIK